MMDTVLVTGEGVRVELPYASLPSRMIAAGIDLAISVVAALLAAFAVVDALGGSIDSALLTAFVIAIIVTCFLGYPAGATARWGQTIGKRTLGLRVVRDDGAPVGFREAFMRELVGFVVEKPGALLGFPALVTMVTREDGKRVGDLLSGTVVLSTRVPVVTRDPVATSPELAQWAQGLDLTRITDQTATMARVVITRVGTLSPAAHAQLAAPVLAEVGAAVGPAPAGASPAQWLGAVLAERRRREMARIGRPVESYGVAAWDR